MTVQPAPTGRRDIDRAWKGQEWNCRDAAVYRVGKLVVWFKETCRSHLFRVASEPERTARSAEERIVKIEREGAEKEQQRL